MANQLEVADASKVNPPVTMATATVSFMLGSTPGCAVPYRRPDRRAPELSCRAQTQLLTVQENNSYTDTAGRQVGHLDRVDLEEQAERVRSSGRPNRAAASSRYAVESGEVVGDVNNFRFKESPVDLLGAHGPDLCAEQPLAGAAPRKEEPGRGRGHRLTRQVIGG
ncbi:hypothetical protein ACFYXH_35405 [Streptomyces sp. NPDC002730]|uniref:hypothetical protein n=1 Tax=Streptomyces sp. NPDC002730 TaxID=3364662 RepID=UPI0036AF4544